MAVRDEAIPPALKRVLAPPLPLVLSVPLSQHWEEGEGGFAFSPWAGSQDKTPSWECALRRLLKADARQSPRLSTPAVTYRDSSGSQRTAGWVCTPARPPPALTPGRRGSRGPVVPGRGRKRPVKSSTGLGWSLASWGLICDFEWNPRFPEV